MKTARTGSAWLAAALWGLLMLPVVAQSGSPAVSNSPTVPSASPVVSDTASPSASVSPLASPSAAPAASPEGDSGWFKKDKLNNLAGVVILFSAVAYYLWQARSGKDMFIRRIAGLQAVEEAVGRATEMGKPILYLPGMKDIDEPTTLAALSILSHVARKSAEYDTPMLVPCRLSLTMSMAQEVVREAHVAAGRAESYNKDNIRYLTDEQFGYVAGVDGIMLREKPAAIFLMGYYYAESLVLAETGHSTGAIQIAGTDATAQLPFFVAACDYTLIGEELYAASAYLSRDPQQVGSLKGQDFAKMLIVLCILIGSVCYTVGEVKHIPQLSAVRELFKI